MLSINNVYFDKMVSQIYSTELQRNTASTSDTEAAFLDLHLNFYNYCDYVDFEIVNFPFLDDDIPRSASNGIYISQLICFVRRWL